MHHFRGRLLEAGSPRLDPANVYIQYHHPAEGGAKEGWSGYLLVASEADLELGGTYTLTLADGRAGDLRVDRLAPDDSGSFRAFIRRPGPLR